MLAEYALVPAVFDASSYSSPEECDKHLRILKDGLTTRGLVRNINGKWFQFLDENRARWHMRGKELLKKMKQQGRLTQDDYNVHSSGLNEDWCMEALASHQQSSLSGVVADDKTAAKFTGAAMVAPISKLTEQTWWHGGKNSIELKRTTKDYLQALGPTLRHSNSIMFIDPHLDPVRKDYAAFIDLLNECGSGAHTPWVQIHRVCYTGSGKERRIPSTPDWKQQFNAAYGQSIEQKKMKVEVFLWDDFHDRYLISNLIGILMPNGFDVEASSPITRWARLDRDHRDSVEKEFDAEVQRVERRHTLVDHFQLGT